MPRGDGTGPMGLGAMTGRAAGYCAGYSVPGFFNPGPRMGLGQGAYGYPGTGYEYQGAGYGYPGSGYPGAGFQGTPYPMPPMPFSRPGFGRGFWPGRGGRGGRGRGFYGWGW